jgi:hypothetical protein
LDEYFVVKFCNKETLKALVVNHRSASGGPKMSKRVDRLEELRRNGARANDASELGGEKLVL